MDQEGEGEGRGHKVYYTVYLNINGAMAPDHTSTSYSIRLHELLLYRTVHYYFVAICSGHAWLHTSMQHLHHHQFMFKVSVLMLSGETLPISLVTSSVAMILD